MADLTPEARAQIAARVAAATAPPPKCHLCGGEMTPQRQTIGEVEFACPGRGPDGEWKPGRTPADQHYDVSRRSRSLVCAAPADLALLLADRAELEAEVAQLRERLAAVADVRAGLVERERRARGHADAAEEFSTVRADRAKAAARAYEIAADLLGKALEG